MWGNQKNVNTHNCGKIKVGAKRTTVYALEGQDVNMVADVKDNDLKQLTVRWIGRRGSASITHRQLTKELNAQRVNIDDDQIHLTLKLINQNLNGTQYRYLVYNNMGQNYTSAWARLIVGSKSILIHSSTVLLFLCFVL